MVLYQEYDSLEHTLDCIAIQVQDSMPYIGDYIPDWISTPKQLFDYLKEVTKYQDDPKGVEYIQTVQTLFKNNGRGDCDCFTVLVLSALEYLGYNDNYIVLKGNSKENPTHIYPATFYKGKFLILDLTNDIYNYDRKYRYEQKLKFENMKIQLADQGTGIPVNAKSYRSLSEGESFWEILPTITDSIATFGSMLGITSPTTTTTGTTDQMAMFTIQQLQTENNRLQTELSRAENRSFLYGGVGLVGGVVLGTLIKKKR